MKAKKQTADDAHVLVKVFMCPQNRNLKSRLTDPRSEFCLLGS